MKSRAFWLCFACTVVALFFCSSNSILYGRSDWTDVNLFMTVARGMHDGKVVYRDLYDQKGPVLFFVYYLLGFLSEGYWPVWLLEVFTYTLFVYYGYCIACLFLDNRYARIGIVPVLSFCPVVTTGFFRGGSLEEMVLWVFMLAMYWVIRAIKFNTWLTGTQVVIIGTCFGLCFWTKYTLCGFFIGACLFVLWRDIKNRACLFRDILLFLSGWFLISIPVFLYCGYHHVFGDMFRVYFYDNIFVYPKNALIGNSSVFTRVGRNLFVGATSNVLSFVCMAVGCLYMFFDSRKSEMRGFLSLTCVWTFISIVVFGVAFCYYGFVFNVFIVFGYVILVRALRFSRKSLMSGFLVLFCFMFLYNKNLVFVDMAPQVEFADYIRGRVPDRHVYLWQCGGLDFGFMQACDSIVPEPYISVTNMALPEMFEFQYDIIKSGVPDYIVFVDDVSGSNPVDNIRYINPDYHIVKSMTAKDWYDDDILYYLYERKGL